MLIVPMFAWLVVDTLRSCALADQLRRKHCGTRHFFSRDLTVQRDEQHPCWKAAHFLPCTRPPDAMHLHRPQRGRIHYGPSHRSAFVTTRSRLHTMPTGGHGDDAAPAAVTGVAAGHVRRFTPIALPHDLQDALAPLDDEQYGSKVFENLGMQDFTPDRVVRVGDLLKRHSYFLSQLCPRYVGTFLFPCPRRATSSLIQDFSPPSSEGCSSGGHFLFQPLPVFSFELMQCSSYLSWGSYRESVGDHFSLYK